jgi:hypothetical protein
MSFVQTFAMWFFLAFQIWTINFINRYTYASPNKDMFEIVFEGFKNVFNIRKVCLKKSHLAKKLKVFLRVKKSKRTFSKKLKNKVFVQKLFLT